jgi:hypothetical protein
MMAVGRELLIFPMSLTTELTTRAELSLTSGITTIISPIGNAEGVILVEALHLLSASSTAIILMPKWVEQEILIRMLPAPTATTHTVLLELTQVECKEERCLRAGLK